MKIQKLRDLGIGGLKIRDEGGDLRPEKIGVRGQFDRRERKGQFY